MQDPDLVFDLLDQDKSECVGMDELLRGVSQTDSDHQCQSSTSMLATVGLLLRHSMHSS